MDHHMDPVKIKTDLTAAVARKDAEATKLVEKRAALDAEHARISALTAEALQSNEVRQVAERNVEVTAQRDTYRADRDKSREAHRAALAMLVARDAELAAANAEIARLKEKYEVVEEPAQLGK